MIPQQEKQIALIEKKITPLVTQASTMTIETPDEMKVAAHILTELSRHADQLDALKTTITAPLNKALKAARELFKPRETLLEGAIATIRRSMGDYQLQADKASQEAAAKLAARVEKGTLTAKTAVRKMGEIDTPLQKIATDGGSVKFRDTKMFEVVDIKLLPLDYHLPDEVAIRAAMRNGQELQGVRYWMKKTVVNAR